MKQAQKHENKPTVVQERNQKEASFTTLSFHIPQAFHTEPMKCAPGVFAIPQPWSNWVHLEGEQGTGGAERERSRKRNSEAQTMF